MDLQEQWETTFPPSYKEKSSVQDRNTAIIDTTHAKGAGSVPIASHPFPPKQLPPLLGGRWGGGGGGYK